MFTAVGAFFLHRGGAPGWIFLIPGFVLVLTLYLYSRRRWLRLDPTEPALYSVWGLVVPLRSRREPYDLSTASRVIFESSVAGKANRNAHSMSDTSRTLRRNMSRVTIVGALPAYQLWTVNRHLARQLARQLALGLDVPLRLSKDDLRQPGEIDLPLGTRLARREPPVPSAPELAVGRLRAEAGGDSGSTRIRLPRTGFGPYVLVPMAKAGCLYVPALLLLGISGPFFWPMVALGPISVMAAGIWYAYSSAVVEVGSNGDLLVEHRYPVGRRRQIIESDELEAIEKIPLVNELEALGTGKAVRFGHSLTNDERRWLRDVLRRAVADRASPVAP